MIPVLLYPLHYHKYDSSDFQNLRIIQITAISSIGQVFLTVYTSKLAAIGINVVQVMCPIVKLCLRICD